MGLEISKSQSLTSAFSAFLVLTLFMGCASTRQRNVNHSPILTTNASLNHTASTYSSTTTIFGTSIEGREIRFSSIGNGSNTILLIAGIHGDEAAGVPLLNRLLHELTTSVSIAPYQRIVIVPEVNPDAVAHNRRTNMSGVDINRNFPAGNHRSQARNGYVPLSEPESSALYELILRINPSVIVSIHQPIACVDYDGPALELAKKISSLCDLPVRKLGSRPGSLGSWAGSDCGIAVITLELPSSASRLNKQALWNLYGEALLSLINR